MGNFYSRLSYSFGNEDWRTEQKALKIKPTDRVLCVTASGDRPLNLLSTELGELISIDPNAIQNALFDLKKAAINQLDYKSYLGFIGAESDSKRLTTYSQLEKKLDPHSIELWRKYQKKIAKGVLYQGAVEQWLKRASLFFRPFRGEKIDRLFAFDDLDEQRDFVKKSWCTFFWEKTFEVCLHPWLTRIFIKDPGLYEYVDEEIHIGKHLYDQVNDFLNRYLAKESVLLSLIFKGEVDKDHYPPYLSESGFEQIRKRLPKARFETIDMLSYLKNAPSESIDCFSCSDIASYIDKECFEQMVTEIHRTARPGARFCIRQFLSNQKIPAALEGAFKRDRELEQDLRKEERCFVYSFMCGTIDKTKGQRL